MKPSKASFHDIQQFLDAKRIAIAGVSRNPKKFGHQIFAHLKAKGYELFPINPATDKTDDIQTFSSVTELPAEVKHLVIITPKKETEKVVMDAIVHGIDHIWIQQMSDTPDAIKIAKEAGIKLVTGQCVFMWFDPVKGIHKFHKTIMNLFGLLPK